MSNNVHADSQCICVKNGVCVMVISEKYTRVKLTSVSLFTAVVRAPGSLLHTLRDKITISATRMGEKKRKVRVFDYSKQNMVHFNTGIFELK